MCYLDTLDSVSRAKPNIEELCSRENFSYLLNYAAGLTRDPAVAEDLVQDAFLAAIKNHDQFGGRSSPRTWLVGILRHKFYDHLRRGSRQPQVLHENCSHEEQESPGEGRPYFDSLPADTYLPSRAMELAEMAHHISRSLEKLPPRQAQVVRLYEIYDLEANEVCARMDISHSSLWVMLHRGRKQLREYLRPLREVCPDLL